MTILESFETFWKLYDKSIKRIECEHLWCKITEQDRADILAYVPKYVQSTPDKKFRKDPATFLFNEGWKDEIIEKAKDPKAPPAVYVKPEPKKTMTAWERYLADKEEVQRMQEEYYKDIKKNTPPVSKPLGLGDRIRQQLNPNIQIKPE